MVMPLLTGMPGGSGVGGMRPTDEQMLQEVGMERERLLQKVPRFVMEGASPDQKTVIEAGTDCLASRDQGMPEQLQELTLENYRLNAERTDNDAELAMMTYMTCSTARMEPGEIGTPSGERADATAMLVACYAEHEDIAGDQPSVEMVEQTLSIFDDDGGGYLHSPVDLPGLVPGGDAAIAVKGGDSFICVVLSFHVPLVSGVLDLSKD